MSRVIHYMADRGLRNLCNGRVYGDNWTQDRAEVSCSACRRLIRLGRTFRIGFGAGHAVRRSHKSDPNGKNPSDTTSIAPNLTEREE